MGEVIEYDSPANLLKNPKSHFFSMAKEARIAPSASTQFLVDLVPPS
jgi:hypothetical protein